jgi:phenylacetate-CoA ligase
VWLQNAAASAEGWRIRRSRYNRDFYRLLGGYLERGALSDEYMRRYRDQRLAAFVRHAVGGTDYYRDLFRSLGAEPEDVRTLEDMQKLPVLDKASVRDRPERFISGGVRPGERQWHHTSGTTGAGLRFPTTARALREQWAVWWRYRTWHGIAAREWCAVFGGRSVVPSAQRHPPFWRYDLAGRQIFFSVYHLSAQNAPAYLRKLERSGIRWLHGYPSVIALLAGHAIDLGVHLRPNWVTLGAESPLPQQRDLIREAFGVAPLSHYGLAEAVANISQCPAGSLHIDEDFAAVELLAQPQGGFRILGTNLSNPALPLLRYDTGDIAAPAGETCPCGRPGRLVADIDGRKEDYIVTKSGALLGRLDHIFKDMVRIREAQIRQERPGAMTVAIVPSADYGEQDERALAAEIRKRVGNDVDFEIAAVTSIARTSRGKLRFVISDCQVHAFPGARESVDPAAFRRGGD